MNRHQRAWLKANPHRAASWLREKLADGFDIHHLDGNHDNNDPLNLLLVEVVDHMRLHDLPLERISAAKIRSDKKKARDESDDVLGLRRGAFTSKKVKENLYWYFQDNRTRKQYFVGRDSSELRKKIATYNKLKDSGDQIAAWNSVKKIIAKHRSV